MNKQTDRLYSLIYIATDQGQCKSGCLGLVHPDWSQLSVQHLSSNLDLEKLTWFLFDVRFVLPCFETTQPAGITST